MFEPILASLRSWWTRLLASWRGSIKQDSTKSLGRKGEQAAAAYLASQGFRIIDANVELAAGEADLIALDPDQETYVIVEVKTRSRRPGQPLQSAQTPPEAAITAHKRSKLRQIASHLKRTNQWTRTRVDVIAIEQIEDGGQPRLVIRHHKDAV